MNKTTIDIKELDDLLCKYEVKDLENLENRLKISINIESKLAESEESRLMAETCIKNLTNKLKKNEEDYGYIKKISKELGLQNFDYEKQLALLKSSEKCLVENLKKANQDKISFAVKQLEQVKCNILCNERYYFNNLNKDVEEKIDNQIKELNERKKISWSI